MNKDQVTYILQEILNTNNDLTARQRQGIVEACNQLNRDVSLEQWMQIINLMVTAITASSSP